MVDAGSQQAKRSAEQRDKERPSVHAVGTRMTMISVVDVFIYIHPVILLRIKLCVTQSKSNVNILVSLPFQRMNVRSMPSPPPISALEPQTSVTDESINIFHALAYDLRFLIAQQ